MYKLSEYLNMFISEGAIPWEDIIITLDREGDFKAKFNVMGVGLEYQAFNKPTLDGYDDVTIIVFILDTEDKSKRFKNINKGFKFARTVIDTVVEITKYYVNKYKPNIISFSTDSESRIVAYERIAEELKRNGYIDNSYYNGKTKVFIYIEKKYYEQNPIGLKLTHKKNDILGGMK